MENTLIKEAVSLLTNKILTPVLYKKQSEYGMCFIGFFDSDVSFGEIGRVSGELSYLLKTPVEILDIRSFNKSIRFDLIKSCEMVYAANEESERLFETSVLMDKQQIMHDRSAVIERNESCRTFYIQ